MNRLQRWVAFVCILTLAVCSAEVRKPDFTLLVPMRDGVELPTDIYLPEGKVGSYPCILMRNPSGRRAEPWVHYATLTKFGYVIAIQDTRSRDGKSMPYVSDGWGEQQDGFDAVEWLAKSPFTDGNLGTIGFSAPGITQLLMAPTAPPSLKCQYVGVAAANLYSQCAFNGGQVLKDQVEGWLRTHGNNQEHLAFVLSQPQYNDFWNQLNTVKVAHRITAPALHYGGWFDIFLQGTIDAFVSRQNHGGVGAKGKQKLVIGPWTHRWPGKLVLGDFEVPSIAKWPPIDISPQRWFDYYLKGIDTKCEEMSPVTYYVMGPFDGSTSAGNVWKTAENWPVPSQQVALYLTPQNKLETRPSEQGTIAYAYDPLNPVPTIGGRNLFLEAGPKDQRMVEQRPDVLVFTTEPLARDMEITGHIFAKIFFETDRDDTDLSVRLSDVYPDGRSILISDGIYRLSQGKCFEGSACKGPFEIEVDLYNTSIVFAKGHAIRLAITSSNYPRYEKNLNSLDNMPQIARNTIHMGKKTPSRLLLPLVK